MPRSCALRIGTFALEFLFLISLLQIGVVDCQNRCPAGGVCEGHLPVDNTFHFDYLDQDIYRWAYKGGECVRLLTRHNRTGCATLSTGTQGTLRYVNNATELAALITENPSYFVAIVAPIQMLNRDVLSNITRGFSKIAGIVFVHETDYVAPPSLVDRPRGSSPDLVSPLNHLRPQSQRKYPPYPWNRGGDGLIFEEFRFAIIGLSEPDSQHVKSRAIWNNMREKSGSFPPHAVEFVFPMQAKTNSIDCLKDNTCLPLGGHSVWSTFDSINRTEGAVQKPIVWGIAGMDTTAFFHQRFARGADSNIAGLVAFLAAVHALSGIRQEILSLPNQIIFAAFDGETYDLVGSRKLVYDLTHKFHCNLGMKPSDKYSNGCWRPFMTSLDFTRIQFNKTFAVIELNQIGLSQPGSGDRTLFAHFEKFGNVSEKSRNRTQSIIDDMNNSAHVIESQRRMQFSLARASNKTVGLPPSSTWSFIDADPEISGIVITDYSEEFNNKYYHSSFDTLRNPGLDHDLICMASTLFARTLYRLAAGEKYNESFAMSRINADCTNNVEYLLECLVNGVACDAVVDRFMTSTDSLQSLPVNSHYTGVYQVQEDFTITGTPKFVYQFLVNATRQDGPDISDLTACTGNYPDCLPSGSICGGDKKQDDGFHCIHSTTYYHPAVDTNLELNYDTKVWSILNRTASLIWTESNWPQIGTRFFQRESPTSAYLAVSGGLVLLILSCCFAWRATVYCNNKFKTL